MPELPKGIQRITNLPTSDLKALWEAIVVPDEIKQRLLSQAVLNFTLRGKVDRSLVPLHGVILLVGPPGTGKTSLAKGLADRTAESITGAKFRMIEVDPHALTSSAMGRTQRAVSDLFAQSISEIASTGPTIVILDEVETLAADRSKMSLEANPIDIHRATDAVLVQLDSLAETHPNLLFIATSNFPQAIDSAFTSRCDLIEQIPMPSAEACKAILSTSLAALAAVYTPISKLTKDARFDDCAKECSGLDGRAIRKMVVTALASSPKTALDPSLLKIDDLISAASAAKLSRGQQS